MTFDSNVTKWIFFGALALIVLWFLYRKFLNPAAINHDSTLLFTGGLGSGKSLNSVKYAKRSYRRIHRRWWMDCAWMRFKMHLGKKYAPEDFPEEPGLYSNIPIRLGWPDFFHRHDGDKEWQAKHWSRVLTREMMIFKTRIPVGSVVFIDELPQFINQFQYDAKGVKDVLNEWITFFRHYINGLFVANAQSLDEVECHIRRKLNTYYYCFDFQPILGIFYRCRILRCRVGDMSISLDNEYIDENAKWHYGLLFLRSYDSRCYRHRYDFVVDASFWNFDDLTTYSILRFDPSYYSPIDELMDVYFNPEKDDPEAMAHD